MSKSAPHPALECTHSKEFAGDEQSQIHSFSLALLFTIPIAPSHAQSANTTQDSTRFVAGKAHNGEWRRPDTSRSGRKEPSIPHKSKRRFNDLFRPVTGIQSEGDGSARRLHHITKRRQFEGNGDDRPETVEAIKKAYVKTLHEPIVDVDLLDFQKAYFIVTGQVTKPGQYDLRYDLTVSEAIALAGGFMPTAKTKVYLYHRSSTGWVEARELKLSDFLHGKSVNEDVDVRSGDMIFVPEKTITKVRKYIPYGIGVPVLY